MAHSMIDVFDDPDTADASAEIKEETVAIDSTSVDLNVSDQTNNDNDLEQVLGRSIEQVESVEEEVQEASSTNAELNDNDDFETTDETPNPVLAQHEPVTTQCFATNAKALAAIWYQIIKCPIHVDVHTNLFGMPGDVHVFYIENVGRKVALCSARFEAGGISELSFNRHAIVYYGPQYKNVMLSITNAFLKKVDLGEIVVVHRTPILLPHFDCAPVHLTLHRLVFSFSNWHLANSSIRAEMRLSHKAREKYAVLNELQQQFNIDA